MKKYIVTIIIIVVIILSFLIGYNTEKRINYDLNSDGVVDMADASILFANFD